MYFRVDVIAYVTSSGRQGSKSTLECISFGKFQDWIGLDYKDSFFAKNPLKDCPGGLSNPSCSSRFLAREIQNGGTFVYVFEDFRRHFRTSRPTITIIKNLLTTVQRL